MSIDSDQLRELIRETLTQVGLYSRNAEELLMLTAAAESNLGSYIKQTRGPAKGVFQMEPATYNDIMYRWLESTSENMRDKVRSFETTFVGVENSEAMVYNLKYAILLARLKYYTIPKPLPAHTDVTRLAEYWKKYYNTPLGKGTVAKAMEKYSKYVKVAA